MTDYVNMFNTDVFANFSLDLRDEIDWKVATIRDIEPLTDITCLSVESVNGLVAVGEHVLKVELERLVRLLTSHLKEHGLGVSVCSGHPQQSKLQLCQAVNLSNSCKYRPSC